ncbi:MAG: hypothetical protein H6708_13055 [Kofleriaceae bacterium]|nr:hypothetical protein [Kofleriaceae bacterium]
MSRGGGCAIALAIALAVIAPGSAPAWADGDAAATAAAAGDDGAGDAGAGDDAAAAPPHLLRWTALIGLGGIVVGGTPLLWTYGSPKVTTWTVPLAVLGTGGLLTAGAAALWGVTGGARRAGAAGADAPWQLEAGTTWVADPLFAEAAYLRLAGAWRRGGSRWRRRRWSRSTATPSAARSRRAGGCVAPRPAPG